MGMIQNLEQGYARIHGCDIENYVGVLLEPTLDQE